ncbi:hypothetical protein ACFQX7_36160 [Luedemannella flava]
MPSIVGSRSSSSSSSAAGTGRWAGAPRPAACSRRRPAAAETTTLKPTGSTPSGLEETAERGRGRLGPGLRHGRGGRRRGGRNGARRHRGRRAAAACARGGPRGHQGRGPPAGRDRRAAKAEDRLGGHEGVVGAVVVPLVLEVLDRRGGRRQGDDLGGGRHRLTHGRRDRAEAALPKSTGWRWAGSAGAGVASRRPSWSSTNAYTSDSYR